MKNKCGYFFSLKRSGNHAIILWLMKNLEGKKVFFNNINNEKEINAFDVEKDFKRTNLYKIDDNQNVFCSCEDYKFDGDIKNKKILEDINKLSCRKYKILILRDPYNQYSSILKSNNDNFILDKNKFVKIWKLYAKEYLNELNYLSKFDGEKVIINYNRWFLNEKYGEDIIKNKFKIVSYCSDINTVPGFGGGSSFNSTLYKNSAKEMMVLERWKSKEVDQKVIQKLFDDKELSNYVKKIFTPIELGMTKEEYERNLNV